MRAAIDLLLPARCVSCGRPGTAACGDCLDLIRCPARTAWPRPAPPGLPTPFAVAAYAGVARSLLLAYKEDGIVALRRPLGEALARGIAAAATGTAGPVHVVAVPSSRAARRRRGDDVVAALVREGVRAARAWGCPVHALPALRHVRRVADSAGLGAGARAANLAAAFGLRRGADRLVPGAAVVLADDLITTGATLAECAATLRAAGADVIGAATVAATARWADQPVPGLHNGRRAH